MFLSSLDCGESWQWNFWLQIKWFLLGTLGFTLVVRTFWNVPITVAHAFQMPVFSTSVSCEELGPLWKDIWFCLVFLNKQTLVKKIGNVNNYSWLTSLIKCVIYIALQYNICTNIVVFKDLRATVSWRGVWVIREVVCNTTIKSESFVFFHNEKKNTIAKITINWVDLSAYLLQKFSVSEGGLLDEVPHSPSILTGNHHTRLPKRNCHFHCDTLPVTRRPCGRQWCVRCRAMVSEPIRTWLVLTVPAFLPREEEKATLRSIPRLNGLEVILEWTKAC